MNKIVQEYYDKYYNKEHPDINIPKKIEWLLVALSYNTGKKLLKKEKRKELKEFVSNWIEEHLKTTDSWNNDLRALGYTLNNEEIQEIKQFFGLTDRLGFFESSKTEEEEQL